MKIVLRKKSLKQFLQKNRKTISLKKITDDPFFFVCVGGGVWRRVPLRGLFQQLVMVAADPSQI